jgi:hypothetical protein
VFLRACRKCLKNGEILTASGHKTFFLGRKKKSTTFEGVTKTLYLYYVNVKKKETIPHTGKVWELFIAVFVSQ